MMNDWNKDNTNAAAVEARQKAVLAFCTEMHKYQPGEGPRGQCATDPTFARTLFAKLGNFYVEGEEIEGQPPRDPAHPIMEISNDTEFRVFEKEDTRSMDKFVLLTLPSTPPDQPLPVLDPVAVWTCTWGPYLQFK